MSGWGQGQTGGGGGRGYPGSWHGGRRGVYGSNDNLNRRAFPGNMGRNSGRAPGTNPHAFAAMQLQKYGAPANYVALHGGDAMAAWRAWSLHLAQQGRFGTQSPAYNRGAQSQSLAGNPGAQALLGPQGPAGPGAVGPEMYDQTNAPGRDPGEGAGWAFRDGQWHIDPMEGPLGPGSAGGPTSFPTPPPGTNLPGNPYGGGGGQPQGVGTAGGGMPPFTPSPGTPPDESNRPQFGNMSNARQALIARILRKAHGIVGR